MLLVNVETIQGKEIVETLGLVKGEIVQTKHIGRDIMAGMKTLVGGEVKGYTKMISEARKEATNRMIEEAQKLGADAIIGVRYSSSEIMEGASEMMAYGTAVRFRN